MTILLYAYIDESLHSGLLKNGLPFFSTDFRYKIGRFRRWQDAQLSLLGRLLLLKGIRLFGEDFKNDQLVYNAYNKPFFNNERIRFNISHSANITVCVVSDEGDVGVDIEWIHAINIDEFKWMMTTGEWDRMQASAKDNTAFFTWWTQKEAVIKANGKGLSIDLKSFEVLDNRARIGNNEYLLHRASVDAGYSCHIAIKNPGNKRVFSPVEIQHIDTAAFIPLVAAKK